MLRLHYNYFIGEKKELMRIVRKAEKHNINTCVVYNEINSLTDTTICGLYIGVNTLFVDHPNDAIRKAILFNTNGDEYSIICGLDTNKPKSWSFFRWDKYLEKKALAKAKLI